MQKKYEYLKKSKTDLDHIQYFCIQHEHFLLYLVSYAYARTQVRGEVRELLFSPRFNKSNCYQNLLFFPKNF